MKFYGKTDTGKVRLENQDCFGIYQILPGVTLCVVCDGMGGVSGGATASREALDAFAEAIRDSILPDDPQGTPDLGNTSLRFAMSGAVEAANRAVWEKANNDTTGKLAGMGTTLVALLIVENGLAYALNVGDSRLYQIRNNKITQLSRDHSYVQDLIDMGKLTYEEARQFPMRNVITRAVGIQSAVRADIFSVDTEKAENEKCIFLLCSDGLCGPLRDEDIIQIVNSDDKPDKKVESLVAAANNAGGPDNITVVLAEV
ncbi:MAG: Stp1/IreP family PP2C-type Ser/Thr phosphatase [Clostridia bacterium]|nr:Stp1/IreP family PP2C-type Ser/Thr phosphatase [Clostridia bacterium]